MGLNTVLPDHVLRLMSKADRAKLGKAGVTAAEAAQKQEAKSERELSDQVYALLTLRGVKFIVRSRFDKKTTQRKGVPDILCCFGGVPLAFELKTPQGKLSTEQHQAGICMLQDGWRWQVITSLDEVRDLLNSIEYSP